MGSNRYGQLGIADGDRADEPLEVPDVDNAVELVSASAASCVRHRTGTVSCWGHNNAAQLGPGPSKAGSRVRDIDGLGEVTRLSAGGNGFCAISSARTIRCWGALGYPVSGRRDGLPEPGLRAPRLPVVSPTDARDIESVHHHGGRTCIRRRSGQYVCWGTWTDGRNSLTRREPETIAELEGMVDVALNAYSVCAIASDASVTCWPSNALGPMKNLGGELPNRISQVPPVVALAPGRRRTCAITRAGRVWCWHDASSMDQPPPFEVPDLADAAQVVIVGENACALRDGEVWCWTGRDWYGGHISIGTFPKQPARVPGF